MLYNWDHGKMKPPQTLLDKCHRVMLKDPVHNLHTIRRWCFDNLNSFFWWEFHDLGDFPKDYKKAGIFWIGTDEDVVLFNLKWQ